jgi:membrane-bound serine protease (ClpP class)
VSRVVRLGVVVAAVAAMGAPALAAAQSSTPTVVTLSATGVVDPFLANYLRDGIEGAPDRGAAAVLISIDTPGGLDSSMREINQAILGSTLPVICFTAPSGARAASAGTFIMFACPENAMAPGTNIGAAHPVGVSGAVESEKVTNDAAAYIRSLAERWGRNADWAEQAVRESVSISSQEAVNIDVADRLADSESDLLAQLDGTEVHAGNGATVTLHVTNATLEPESMGFGAALLHGLFDPNLAFLFFYLGLALIVIELLHPGISVPGILGTLLLILAFVSFGLLPVQLAGVVCLIASAVCFLLELKHPGLGLPLVGGVVFLVLGGLLLFNRSVPNAQVSPWLLGVVAALLVGFFGFVVTAVVKAKRLRPVTGTHTLIGETGVALSTLDPDGNVRVRWERWSALSLGGPIPNGSRIRVVEVRGVRLVVEPETAPAEEPGMPPGTDHPARSTVGDAPNQGGS